MNLISRFGFVCMCDFFQRPFFYKLKRMWYTTTTTTVDSTATAISKFYLTVIYHNFLKFTVSLLLLAKTAATKKVIEGRKKGNKKANNVLMIGIHTHFHL